MDDIELARWLSSPESKQAAAVEPPQESAPVGTSGGLEVGSALGRGHIAPKPTRGMTLAQQIAQQQAAAEMFERQCGILPEADAARINAMYEENALRHLPDLLLAQQAADPNPGPFSPERIQARVDAVLPEGCLQFDGPPTAHVFGHKYFVVGMIGDDAEEAISGYLEQLRRFCEKATQVAWRRRTQIASEKDFEANCTRCEVTGRLAVWR